MEKGGLIYAIDSEIRWLGDNEVQRWGNGDGFTTQNPNGGKVGGMTAALI